MFNFCSPIVTFLFSESSFCMPAYSWVIHIVQALLSEKMSLYLLLSFVLSLFPMLFLFAHLLVLHACGFCKTFHALGLEIHI